jgi:hypothetical protein
MIPSGSPRHPWSGSRVASRASILAALARARDRRAVPRLALPSIQYTSQLPRRAGKGDAGRSLAAPGSPRMIAWRDQRSSCRRTTGRQRDTSGQFVITRWRGTPRRCGHGVLAITRPARRCAGPWCG